MKAKVVILDGQKFYRGWSRCIDCEKRIKYLLLAEIAIFTLDTQMLCIDCKWLYDSPELSPAGVYPVIRKRLE